MNEPSTTIDRIVLDQPQPGSWRWGFTGRAGGVSRDPYASLNLARHVGDDGGAVDENRSCLVSAVCGERGAAWLSGMQVHGTAVITAPSAPRELVSWPACGPEGDIILSTHPGYLLAVLVADCIPILLADPQHGVFLTVHAGWRGTLAHVARQAVGASLVAGASPGTLYAALGPGIGPCCFAVGPDVAADFWAQFGAACPSAFHRESPGETRLDLWALNQADLAAAGLADDHLQIARHCTSCESARFFSYRASGGTTGRQAGYIYTGAP